jgi:hypothetical protein
VYKQKHTVTATRHLLYKTGGYWYISRNLGGEGGFLRAPAGSDSTRPPGRGWQFWAGAWVGDPSLEAVPPATLCTSVTLQLTGPALAAHRALAGYYRMEPGQWCVGRPVYRQTAGNRLFLNVVPGSNFGVRTALGDRSPRIVTSAAGGTCPCSYSPVWEWRGGRGGVTAVCA